MKQTTGQAGVDHCDGVMWLGNVDWWYHNRGHASTRMACRLARVVPTVWVNSIGMRMPVPGRTEIAWKRYGRKMKSLLKGLRRDSESGMWIYSPLFIPRYSLRMLELNGLLLALQLRIIMRHLGIRHPSACVSMPTMTPAVERLAWVSVVFDRCDDFTTLPQANQTVIGQMEHRLLDRCDHAAYVNDDLFKREQGRVADAQFIGHGVDYDRLVQARPLDGSRNGAPAQIQGLPRPIVGFFGAMDEYRMDVTLMIKIARHIPGGTLLLIGPQQMDLTQVKAEPNVRHLPQLPPAQLPRYAAHFDVGIIPFLQNEFNRRCNPTKLKEYLALGYPTVAMRLPAYRRYEQLLYLADSHEQFLEGLNRALAESDVSHVLRRREAVAGDSWDKVADRMGSMLGVGQPDTPKVAPQN